LRELSTTYGYGNDPIYSTAVGNFGQYTKVRSSELMEMKKTKIVKSVLFFLIMVKNKEKPWLIHVPAAAVIHEW